MSKSSDYSSSDKPSVPPAGRASANGPTAPKDPLVSRLDTLSKSAEAKAEDMARNRRDLERTERARTERQGGLPSPRNGAARQSPVLTSELSGRAANDVRRLDQDARESTAAVMRSIPQTPRGCSSSSTDSASPDDARRARRAITADAGALSRVAKEVEPVSAGGDQRGSRQRKGDQDRARGKEPGPDNRNNDRRQDRPRGERNDRGREQGDFGRDARREDVARRYPEGRTPLPPPGSRPVMWRADPDRALGVLTATPNSNSGRQLNRSDGDLSLNTRASSPRRQPPNSAREERSGGTGEQSRDRGRDGKHDRSGDAARDRPVEGSARAPSDARDRDRERDRDRTEGASRSTNGKEVPTLKKQVSSPRVIGASASAARDTTTRERPPGLLKVASKSSMDARSSGTGRSSPRSVTSDPKRDGKEKDSGEGGKSRNDGARSEAAQRARNGDSTPRGKGESTPRESRDQPSSRAARDDKDRAPNGHADRDSATSVKETASASVLSPRRSDSQTDMMPRSKGERGLNSSAPEALPSRDDRKEPIGNQKSPNGRYDWHSPPPPFPTGQNAPPRRLTSPKVGELELGGRSDDRPSDRPSHGSNELDDDQEWRPVKGRDSTPARPRPKTSEPGDASPAAAPTAPEIAAPSAAKPPVSGATAGRPRRPDASSPSVSPSRARPTADTRDAPPSRDVPAATRDQPSRDPAARDQLREPASRDQPPRSVNMLSRDARDSRTDLDRMRVGPAPAIPPPPTPRDAWTGKEGSSLSPRRQDSRDDLWRDVRRDGVGDDRRDAWRDDRRGSPTRQGFYGRAGTLPMPGMTPRMPSYSNLLAPGDFPDSPRTESRDAPLPESRGTWGDSSTTRQKMAPGVDHVPYSPRTNGLERNPSEKELPGVGRQPKKRRSLSAKRAAESPRGGANEDWKWIMEDAAPQDGGRATSPRRGGPPVNTRIAEVKAEPRPKHSTPRTLSAPRRDHRFDTVAPTGNAYTPQDALTLGRDPVERGPGGPSGPGGRSRVLSPRSAKPSTPGTPTTTTTGTSSPSASRPDLGTGMRPEISATWTGPRPGAEDSPRSRYATLAPLSTGADRGDRGTPRETASPRHGSPTRARTFDLAAAAAAAERDLLSPRSSPRRPVGRLSPGAAEPDDFSMRPKPRTSPRGEPREGAGSPLRSRPEMSDARVTGDKTRRKKAARHPPSLDNYRIERTLGKGNFANVLKGVSKHDNRTYAIKEIKDVRQKRGKNRACVTTEVKVTSAVSRHPNIVKYKEAMMNGENVYIVLEYVGGGTLKARVDQEIRAGRLQWTEEKVLRHFVQICLAVKHLHDNDILHRDLKLENCFLTEDGRIKLGDFGLSAQLEGKQYTFTQTGTPTYMSPEISRGVAYDKKTDIWSLGIVLYEMATGACPFLGPSLGQLVQQIKYEQQKPMVGYSAELRALCDWMLTKEPTGRPDIDTVLNSPIMRRAFALLPERDQASFQKYDSEHGKLKRSVEALHSDDEDERAAGLTHVREIEREIDSPGPTGSVFYHPSPATTTTTTYTAAAPAAATTTTAGATTTTTTTYAPAPATYGTTGTYASPATITHGGYATTRAPAPAPSAYSTPTATRTTGGYGAATAGTAPTTTTTTYTAGTTPYKQTQYATYGQTPTQYATYGQAYGGGTTTTRIYR